jgi:flagellar protein FliO/FliZ
VAAVLFLLAPGEALAASFQKDTTPLPPSVSGAGAPAQGEATTSPAGGNGSAGSIVRMIVGLAIVIAVIYGVYWLLKALNRSRLNGGDGRLAIVATTQLAPNRSVHLIRVGEELVLVGAAEQGVTPIRVYGADEARRLEPLLDGTGQPPFAPTAPPAERRSGSSFGQRFLNELRQRTVRG